VTVKLTPQSKASEAFTLIELLVVIAIVAVLAALLLPGLSRARARALGAACLGNLRQVSLAGQMYITDHRDYLVPNNPPDIGDASQPYLPTWAGVSVAYGVPYSTNDSMLLGGDPTQPGIGVLGPYVKSARIFRCPADRSTTLLGGQRYPRNRSYAMNGFIGTEYLAIPHKVPSVLTVNALAALNRPEILTWMDIHEDYLDSCIINVVDGTAHQEFEELPAGRHYGGAAVAFIDGHGELHKWQDQSTLAPVTGVFSRFYRPITGRTRDWLWMRQRMIRATTDTW
jgi:prepilin-type N-terminal cleavage/methylation domain-containing protein/prepilin-type processing-associated H-X9-DG protein